MALPARSLPSNAGPALVAGLVGVAGVAAAVLAATALPDIGVPILDSIAPPLLVGFAIAGLASAYYHRETSEHPTRPYVPGFVALWAGGGLLVAGLNAELSTTWRLALVGLGFAAAVTGHARVVRLRRSHGVEPTDERLRRVERLAVQRSWQVTIVALIAAMLGLLALEGATLGYGVLVLVGVLWLAVLSRRLFEGYYASTR